MFDYDKVRELKKKGKFEECTNIYCDYMDENNISPKADIDAKFFDGYSKILILREVFDLAAKVLSEELAMVYKNVVKIAEALEKGTNMDLSYALVMARLTDNLKRINILQKAGVNAIDSAHDLGITDWEIAVGTFSDMADLNFKCLFCRSNMHILKGDEVRTILYSEFNKSCRKNYDSIMHVFQGIATPDELKEYEETFNIYAKHSNRFIIDLDNTAYLIQLRNSILNKNKKA